MSTKLLTPALYTHIAGRSTARPRPFFTIRPLIVSNPHAKRSFTASFAMDADQAKGKSELPDKDQWKSKPPYKLHEPNEHFKARYEASCHCGKVKYQLSRQEPLDSKLCHCTTCQTQHGKSSSRPVTHYTQAAG